MADFNILQYGAVADGTTLNTQAIQNAIDAAAVHGGRTVVPTGIFLTGTLILKSGVTLVLEEGAVILGSPRLEDYRHPTGWGWSRSETDFGDITPWHLIQARDAERIGIIGPGTIAGNGPAFWYPDRPHEWAFWRHRANQRPSPMVHLDNCRTVRIENLTLRDSAGWTLHLHDCESVRITGVTVRNTYFGPNTDGFDICSCRDVTISDCDIATGDDAIVLMGSRHGGPCADIAITNCILRTSCVGLRFNTFDDGARIRRVTATNLLIPRCSRLFDLRSQNGADIEDITISNCIGSTNCGWPVNRPFEIVAIDNAPENSDNNRSRRAGTVQSVTLSNINILTDGRALVVASGAHRVRDITLSDIRIRYALLDDPYAIGQSPRSGGPWMPGVENADVRGARAAIIAKRVENLAIRGLAIHWPSYPVPSEWFLLDSPQRLINRDYFAGNETRIRSGELRPTFKAFWSRELTGAQIDLSGLKDSAGGPPEESAD
ncbi:MAG: glycosyl hydrolase family 28 protein [Phycisphaerae bacterium]